MVQVIFFFFLILTFSFKVEVLSLFFLHKIRGRAKITIAIKFEVEHLPSNGATANVIHNDPDLHFQGHEFWNVNISKTVTASEKCFRYDFYRSWYMPSNGNTANGVLHDIYQYFQGQTFQVAILTVIGKLQALLLPWNSKSDIYHRMVLLPMLYSVTLT